VTGPLAAHLRSEVGILRHHFPVVRKTDIDLVALGDELRAAKQSIMEEATEAVAG